MAAGVEALPADGLVALFLAPAPPLAAFRDPDLFAVAVFVVAVFAVPFPAVVRLAVDFAGLFFAADLLAEDFFATPFFATVFFAAVFFTGDVFATAFFVAPFAAAFFVAVFVAAVFFAAVFLGAGLLAAAPLVLVFPAEPFPADFRAMAAMGFSRTGVNGPTAPLVERRAGKPARRGPAACCGDGALRQATVRRRVARGTVWSRLADRQPAPAFSTLAALDASRELGTD